MNRRRTYSILAFASGYDVRYWVADFIPPKSPYHFYPLSPEGAAFLQKLVGSLVRTYPSYDSLGEAVFADWLEEHREEVLSLAAGPTDPVAALDEFITALRTHFRSQFEPAE